MQSLAPDSGSSFRARDWGAPAARWGKEPASLLLLLAVLGLLLPLPAPPRPRLGSARPPLRKGKKGERSGPGERSRAAAAAAGEGAAGAALAAAPAERAWSRRAGSTGGRAAYWPGPGPRAPHRPQPGHPDLPGVRGAPAGGGRGGDLRAPASALPGGVPARSGAGRGRRRQEEPPLRSGARLGRRRRGALLGICNSPDQVFASGAAAAVEGKEGSGGGLGTWGAARGGAARVGGGRGRGGRPDFLTSPFGAS